jgi:glycosyltransferase involved in cell wall biosynthesis
MEAMAARLPIVMTHVGGAGTLVRDGENGFVVPPDDVNQLTATLERLLADESRRRELGNRGSELVQEFSIQKMVEKTVALYQSLAARRAGT